MTARIDNQGFGEELYALEIADCSKGVRPLAIFETAATTTAEPQEH
jgi:hypothetical protein